MPGGSTPERTRKRRSCLRLREERVKGEGRGASGKNVARRWCRCSWTVAEERRVDDESTQPSARSSFSLFRRAKWNRLCRIRRMLFASRFATLRRRGNVSKYENYREFRASRMTLCYSNYYAIALSFKLDSCNRVKTT